LDREVVFDIGEQELLMLLLVVDSEREHRRDFAHKSGVGLLYEREHGLVHMVEVGIDLPTVGRESSPRPGRWCCSRS
jgi:hypothetical protein